MDSSIVTFDGRLTFGHMSVNRIEPPDKIQGCMNDLCSEYNRVYDRWPRVVQCSGCFDLLHTAHIEHLEHARLYGDLLVVSLNCDAVVTKLKGKGRPVFPLEERLRLVAALRPVTVVTWFEEDIPNNIISKIRPDIYVKGAETILKDMPELEEVMKWGAVRFTPRHGEHSTDILERIKL